VNVLNSCSIEINAKFATNIIITVCISLPNMALGFIGQLIFTKVTYHVTYHGEVVYISEIIKIGSFTKLLKTTASFILAHPIA